MTAKDPAEKPAAEPTGAPAPQPAETAAPAAVAVPAWRPTARQVGAVLAIVVLCAVIAIYLLPRQPMIGRSVTIAAPPATAFTLVSDLRRFQEWAPFLAGETADRVVFTGPTEGVGQTMTWPGVDGLAGGKAVVTALDPGKSVDLNVDIDDQQPWLVSLAVVPQGDGSEVIWRMRPDLGFSPVARVLGLGADGRFGPEMERGLARLKAVAEAPPEAPAEPAPPAAAN